MLNILQNLISNNVYEVAGRGIENPKRLKLLVGKKNFIDENISELKILPNSYELCQNFPNPFNPTTMLRYILPNAEKITLKVYNLLGEEVVTLINNEYKSVGDHFVIWNGRDHKGQLVAEGIYIYHIRAGGYSMIKKMVLVK